LFFCFLFFIFFVICENIITFAGIIAQLRMKKILLVVLLSLGATATRAQMFVAGTEVTSDILMAPSVSLELVTGDKSSVVLSGFMTAGSWLKPLKEATIKALQPEWRYWLSGRPVHKFFVGVGGIGALYDITLKGKVYDGYALGLGATYGYVVNITDRLNIDIHSGFGFLYYKRKEYYLHDNYDVDFSTGGQLRANSTGYYLLPTRVGVSVTYVLK